MSNVTGKIVVLGDGGWGTTLALLLSQKGYAVTVWGAFPEYIRVLRAKRVNQRYLPGVKIPDSVLFESDLKTALAGKKEVVLAIPSQHMREVLRKIAVSGYSSDAVYVSVTKGIENGSLKRMSEVIREELGAVRFAVLSGPTIALEVAQRIPTAAVIASRDRLIRTRLQKMFMTDRFRIYTNNDVVGIELGGSLKNVIAIACGISDGLGFGTNTKAAILSRGLAEMARLGKAMGAQSRTFFGISGLGDLVTTCSSPHSRNRFVGEAIGKGKTLKQVVSHMKMVAEGVATSESAYALSRVYKVDMPIIKEVYSVLYKGKSPHKALRDLMTRKGKKE